jgi:hypothetical protein
MLSFKMAFFPSYFLQSLLSPLLRILGMSDPALDLCIELPHNNLVPAWEHSVINAYTSADPDQGPTSRARMQNLKVLELRRYKETSTTMEHEYLVAKIARPSSSHTFLRIDRSGGEADVITLYSQRKDDANSELTVLQSSNDAASSRQSFQSKSMSISSLLSMGKLDATDAVCTVHSWPTCDSLTEKVVCKNQCSLILLDLVLLAKVVHDYSDKYRLLRRQCYWYADMIMRVLQASFSDVTSNRDLSLKQHDDEHWEVEEYDEMSGTWKSIRIHETRKGMVNDIKHAFERRRLHVRKLVRVTQQSLLQLATIAHTSHRSRSRKAMSEPLIPLRGKKKCSWRRIWPKRKQDKG